MNGNRANQNGARLEAFVEVTLQACDYQRSSNGKELFKHRAQISGQYYAPQVGVGPTAFGGRSKRIVDFLLVNKEVFPEGHLFECKWQQTIGSAERKLASTVNDARETFRREGVPTTIIYGGPGFNPDTIAWLKKQVGSGLYAVWAMEEFQAAVNDGFLGTGDFKQHGTRSQESRNSLYHHGGLWDTFFLKEEAL